MAGRFDAATRNRARAALRGMAARCEGPRLRTRWPWGRAGRIAHAVGRAVEIVFALLLAGGVTLAALLARGPIHLARLHDRIAMSLQERVGDRYAITLGPTYLMHNSWGVGLGFGGLTLRDSAGRKVLSAPSGALGLDPFALMMAQVKVRRLELDGLDLRLRVAADGALSLAVSNDSGATPIVLPGPASSGEGAPGLAALVRAAAEAMAGASQALDRLTLAKGHLVIDNEATQRTIVYDAFTVVFDRSGSAARAEVSAIGPAGRWTVAARASGADAPAFSFEARDLSLDDIRAFAVAPPPLTADAPIAIKFDARVTPQSKLEALTARFTVGAGRVRINNPDAVPFFIDEATGAVAWDEGARQFRVERLEVLAGETRVEAHGSVTPPADAVGAWTTHLESREARFGPERAGDKTVVLDSVVADARFFQSPSRFVLDGLNAQGPTVNASIKAETAPDGALKLDLQVAPSATNDLVRLWPQFINPDVRDWCAHNLHGGQLRGSMTADWTAADLDAMANKRALPRDSIHGEFSSRDVGVDLMPGLSVMTTEEGAGSFTGRDFNISGKRATMTLSPTRRIQASDLVFTVPDTTPAAIVNATARARVSATADALADLIGREPLRREAGLSIDPATVRGQAEGDLVLDLKLGKTARPQDTQFHATGTLTNFQLDKFLAEEKFEQATVTFEVDRSSLKMVGDGQLLGAATHVEVGRGPGDEGSATVTFTLDAAARAKRGMNFGSWLTGPLPVKLKAPLTRASAAVEIDLTPAAVDNPVPGVSKPAGKPGKATFVVKPAPEGASLSNIAIDFGAALMRGSAELGPDGAVQSARITQARISPGDDFKADVVNGSGALKVSVLGSTLDARPFIKSLFAASSPSQSAARDLDLDLKVANVVGANKQSIAGLELNLSRRGGEDRVTSLRGRIGAGAVGASRDAAGDLRLISSDAGALFRFADLYSRMEGGALDVTLRTTGDSNAGEAKLTNFVLRDEPAFRQLFAAGQAARAGADGAAVDPTLVRFQKMTATFVRSPGRLAIQDAVIFNPYLGLTTQGVIDFERSEIDVSGSFVPAYQVNTMLTKIPLVGMILAGGQNEGVFGISYRVHGPMSGPMLTVNPLSAMAPGILRRILGAIDGTTARIAPPAEELGAARGEGPAEGAAPARTPGR